MWPACAATTATASPPSWTPLPGASGGRPGARCRMTWFPTGRDEARVELDFLARDSCYRAVRSRRRAGGRRRQGSGDLQLLALGEGGSTPQVISGNTLRETQAKIEHLVGMDYDTFINSAFLLQGRARRIYQQEPGRAQGRSVVHSWPGILRPLPGPGQGTGRRKAQRDRPPRRNHPANPGGDRKPGRPGRGTGESQSPH